MHQPEPLSFTVEVGGVTFRVARRAELERLSQGWPASLYRHLPHTPLGYLLPAGCVTQQVLTAAGHDWSKIDSALPEDWADEYQRKHGYRPWACWSYEARGDFAGRPIFLEDVYVRLDRLILDAVWERVYALVEAA